MFKFNFVKSLSSPKLIPVYLLVALIFWISGYTSDATIFIMWGLVLVVAVSYYPLAWSSLFKRKRRNKVEEGSTSELVSRMLKMRDAYTYKHSLRVSDYCRLICKEMGLEAQLADKIVLAGELHDMGKIEVDTAILNKPGQLTAAEWVEMRKHPAHGADLLNKYGFEEEIIDYVLHHHEAWSGNGYPNQLASEQIPLGARIIAVADAFDAMTSDRCYRAGMPTEVAISILLDGSNKQWDGNIVQAFLNGLSRLSLEETAPLNDQIFAA